MLKKFKLSEINCSVEYGSGYSGHCFAYLGNPVCEFIQKEAIDLGVFLVKPIALSLAKKQPAKPVMFYFSANQNMYFLFVGSKHNFDFSSYFRKIPGYYESGADVIPNDATPLAYWDGTSLFHLLPVHEGFEGKEWLAVDYGNLFCVSVERWDKESYLHALKNPEEYYQYSLVPNSFTKEYCDKKGHPVSVTYALCI